MSGFGSTKFKALKKVWDEKLKRSGFKDIEDSRGRFIDHRTREDFVARLDGKRGLAQAKNGAEILRLDYESVQAYYYWATDMAQSGRFRSTADKKIWALHAQGASVREIAEQLPLHPSTIARNIKKIRDYLRLQMPKKKAA